MQRALDLARLGLGNVSPNPLVGCVIIHENEIIGEGWHQHYGGPHAEVNAIYSVQNKDLLSSSTLYVTLEPCAHVGKTPPCVNLIIDHQIPHVVICNLDPFEQVNGKGIDLLKAHGIEVTTGVLEDKGRHLNRRFFTSIEKKRPYITLKWAQTRDGFVARSNFDSKWISNEQSRKRVHQLRAQEDAILVGFNTAKHDNPRLTTRDWEGKNPLRIVIDRKKELNPNLHLFTDGEETICFTQQFEAESGNVIWIKIPFHDMEMEIIESLHHRGIQSLLVEGGASTISGFLQHHLWDEAFVFTSAAHFGEGIKAPHIEGSNATNENVLGDTLTIYQHG